MWTKIKDFVSNNLVVITIVGFTLTLVGTTFAIISSIRKK